MHSALLTSLPRRQSMHFAWKVPFRQLFALISKGICPEYRANGISFIEAVWKHSQDLPPYPGKQMKTMGIYSYCIVILYTQ